MKRASTSLFGALLFLSACASCGEDPVAQREVVPVQSLVGQLLLPGDELDADRRGVEVLVRTRPGGSGIPLRALPLDGEGRFSHEVVGEFSSVEITAGTGYEFFRLDASDSPQVSRTGELDLGQIDLRERLMRHVLIVRGTEGQAADVVRVAMWRGPPPVGPQGESVSLGSSQFPPVVLGAEVEWLLPHGAEETYFLIESPDGPGRGIEWRSGRQRLFGPYGADELPRELIMD